MSFMGKLQSVYDYFIFILKNLQQAESGVNKKVEPYFARLSFKKKVSYLLYSYIRDLYEYNKFPEIIEEKDFKKNKQKFIYHGFEKYEHGANFLCDWNFHQGNWFYNGFYFSENQGDAESYCINYKEKITLKAKLNNDNGVTENNLFRVANYLTGRGGFSAINIQLRGRIDKLEEKFDKLIVEDVYTKGKFRSFICQDISKLAILLGYDYIRRDGCHVSDRFEHIIILNRGALCVSKEEYNRFCRRSDNYKDYCTDDGNSYEKV